LELGHSGALFSADLKGALADLGEHEVPCHHKLVRYLDEYIAAADIASDADSPLFRTAGGKTGALRGKAMWQQDAYRMIQRRAAAAGIKIRIGNHNFRATGRHHHLPEKQRQDRSRAAYSQPRVAEDDQALRFGIRMRLGSMRSSGL
jgi:hypothetical protein